jgi:hypothetical protein
VRLVPDEGSGTERIVVIGERFMKFVEPEPNTGCWIWTGNRDRKGYGQFWWMGRRVRACRFVIGLEPGPIEPDHLCRNTWCVNPRHLEAVTRQVNLRRGMSPVGLNYRKTHCYKGHEFDPANTRMVGEERRCKACERGVHNRYYQRHKITINQARREKYAMRRQGSP